MSAYADRHSHRPHRTTPTDQSQVQKLKIIHFNSGYIKYRQLCGLKVPSSWEERPKEISQGNWDNLKLVYNKVDDIDAFTGGVSESSISDGVVGKAVKVLLSKTW